MFIEVAGETFLILIALGAGTVIGYWCGRRDRTTAKTRLQPLVVEHCHFLMEPSPEMRAQIIESIARGEFPKELKIED